jgi:hypothetical protein
MKNLNILRTLIREELAKLREGHNEMENYMFFQNVKSINDATSQILQMDPGYVDSILSDGHQWAVDHIATSADDVSEVHAFLVNRQPLMEELDPKEEALQSIKQSVNDLLGWGFSTIGLTSEQEQELIGVAAFLKKLAGMAAKGSSDADQGGNSDLFEKKSNLKFTPKYNEFGDNRDKLPDNLQRRMLRKK